MLEVKEITEYSGTNYLVIGINGPISEVLKRCDSFGSAKSYAEYHIALDYDRVVVARELKIYEAIEKIPDNVTPFRPVQMGVDSPED